MDVQSWKQIIREHPNRERRCEAIHQLVSQWGAHLEVVNLLIERAKQDNYWKARTISLQLLADIAGQNETVCEFIIACAEADTDSRVRSSAIETLPQIWTQGTGALKHILSNWLQVSFYADVRQTALLMICEQLRDASILSLLAERAEQDPDPIVRLVAVEALARDWRDDPSIYSFLCERAQRDNDPDVRRAAKGVALQKISVFVSYSHDDARYVKLLIDYLSGELRQDGIELWSDERIITGALWDNEIRSKIRESHIALVLVSQRLLNSDYCQKVEIRNFLRQRRSEGLVIFPIIISACAWDNYDWLSGTQFLPTGNKNLKSHYKAPGKREELFYRILLHLQQVSREIRQGSKR